MLSDDTRRQIYDVYGQQGLDAGLEIVPHSRGPSQREQWERFQKEKVPAHCPTAPVLTGQQGSGRTALLQSTVSLQAGSRTSACLHG